MKKNTLFTGSVEYARAEKILINEEESKFQTQSHPNLTILSMTSNFLNT